MADMATEIALTPAQLHQMQLVQLEMLLELDRICRENNIKYSIDGGTLLGAVRHKGFIPWDDDIDVIMTRQQYTKFYNACIKEKKLDSSRFFLQDYRTDKHYYVGYARIRRKNTVYERVGHEHMGYQRGIFIDIFILDSVPDNLFLRKIHTFFCFCLRKMLWAKSGKVLHKNRLLRAWYTLISNISRDFIFDMLMSLASLCNKNQSTKLVRHMTHPYPNKKMCGMPRQFLHSYTQLEFEGHNFYAVGQYHNYLTMLYGDYMQLPSEDKRKTHIHLSAFSADIKEKQQ